MGARAEGSVLDLPGFAAFADDGRIVPARAEDFIAMPEGTLLLQLPGRSPAHGPDQMRAVAAALPLGYTRTLLPAYVAAPDAPPLPLYGYTAVAWSRGGLAVAAVRTDALETWSAQAHAPQRVARAIVERDAEFPGNGMLAQLRRCATEYGCYTAQNAFLRSGEAALPVSPACNASCIGCISAQEMDAGIRSAQERIRRLPEVAEISDVATAHLEADPAHIVSFGQGCEGEPLLAAPLVEQAITAIRRRTRAGTIHCNTNASRPQALARLCAAGLQSIRVSLNSTRANIYAAYYRPRGYDFSAVRRSLDVAAAAGVTISLNLLTHPGVTDDPAEMEALSRLLRAYPIAMLQTRTLNVDPQVYFAAVGRPATQPFGMRAWLTWLCAQFPRLAVGNFTRGFG
ncbi:MAG: radical SAM protein [Candidatus Eremiobacteraeota bacterium]|nr:radical SAM protein [Candidatus Eremiobacteraeota bacterium]